MSDFGPLSRPLVDALGQGATPRVPDAGALEEALARFLDEGRGRWKGVAVDADRFLAFVARCLSAEGPVVDALADLHPADLYLAFACADKQPRALAAFDAEFQPVVDAALRRMRLSETGFDELKQSLREQLFVAPSGKDRPMIGNYSGHGQLKNWLRVTTVRTTTKWLDRQNREIPVEDEALDAVVPTSDPELERLKAGYHAEFRAAFREAMGALDSQERTVLQQHYLDELTLEQLAALYRVHRATVARWLSRGRETLLERTRAALMRTLSLSPPEYESLMRLLDSQLQLTLRSLFGPPGK